MTAPGLPRVIERWLPRMLSEGSGRGAVVAEVAEVAEVAASGRASMLGVDVLLVRRRDRASFCAIALLIVSFGVAACERDSFDY